MTNQRTERSSRAATSGSSVVYFIFACVATLAVLAMPIYQFFSVGSNAGYACITGYVPPGIDESGMTALLDSRETAFPAGRYCEWASISGDTTAYQTGWPTTIVACIATVLVIWMTILAVRSVRPRKLLVALVPSFVVLLSWAAVFI